MGLTERHWFEDEEPELTERQLEDVISMQDEAYKRGYHKGYSDGSKDQEIITELEYKYKYKCMNTKIDMVKVTRCKDCKKRNQHHECEYGYHSDNWFCADGERK